MYTLDSLKKKTANMDKLNEKLDSLSKKGYEKDERYWSLSVDKQGVGEAVIRFLPEPGVDQEKLGEDAVPVVLLHHHSFKGPTGKWYIENSRTTIGPWAEADPVNEMNRFLYQTLGGNENEEWVRKNSSIKKSFIANIYIVDDPANPENNGKVFLFKFGKEIMEMIEKKRKPQFATTPKVNVFDPFNGCHFRLRAYNKASSGERKFRSYTQSEWMGQGPIDENPEKVVEICNSAHSLFEEINPDTKFKTYAELERQLNDVMGHNVKERINKHTLGDAAPKPQKSLKEDLDDEVPDIGGSSDDSPPFDVSDSGDDVDNYFSGIET